MACKVAVDCDGVLADFNLAFLDLLQHMFPGRVPKDFVPTSWDYPINELGLTQQEYKAAWKAVHDTPNFWLKMNPMWDNVGALATFLTTKANEDVWIVTARSATQGMTVAIQTQLWLNSCGLFPHLNYLGVITGAGGDDKITVYKAMGIQYSIDDKAETVEQCDTLHGHKAYLLDQTWNQHAQVKRRVKSLKEFLDEVGK